MRRTSAVKPGSARHAGAGRSSKRHGKGHAPGPAAKLRRHRLRRHRLRRPPGFIDPGSSPTAINAASLMTPQMVDRMFWRAGFGPTSDDRAKWIGQPVGDLVDWFLTTPAGSAGVPGSDSGNPFDPTGNDTDLVLSWVDVMIRAINPFVERLTFFWHRHWANSRAQVSPPQLLMTQTQLFRSYADLASNPTASFKRHGDTRSRSIPRCCAT
jgi:phosphatidylserine/phosphatidylglycerophosphate/cardiolipin synthase-like enzyme